MSFFLGQAQAKLFAHDFFRVSRFVHYDAYLSRYSRPRKASRPDFIGFYGRRVAIAVEAKGRSRGCPDELVKKAKSQAASLPKIQGYHAPITYAHVAYFSDNEWCAYLEDPPARSSGELIDPALLTAEYYIPIVNAIRTPGILREPIPLEQAEGLFISRYFPEVDITLSVRNDIAQFIPSDGAVSSGTLDYSEAADLYGLALGLDEEMNQKNDARLTDDRRFLGSDGVAVELGSSWDGWIDASDQRPDRAGD